MSGERERKDGGASTPLQRATAAVDKYVSPSDYLDGLRTAYRADTHLILFSKKTGRYTILHLSMGGQSPNLTGCIAGYNIRAHQAAGLLNDIEIITDEEYWAFDEWWHETRAKTERAAEEEKLRELAVKLGYDLVAKEQDS